MENKFTKNLLPIFLGVFFALIFFAHGANAATYYASATDGNSTCNGSSYHPYNATTNPNNCPYATYAAVNGVPTGSTLKFKRGDTWTAAASNQYILPGGNNQTYDTYFSTADGSDDSSQAKPIFDANGIAGRIFYCTGKSGITMKIPLPPNIPGPSIQPAPIRLLKRIQTQALP